MIGKATRMTNRFAYLHRDAIGRAGERNGER